MHKLQLMLAARHEAVEALGDELATRVELWQKEFGEGQQPCLLTRLPDDPFRRTQPAMRAYDAVLEFPFDPSDPGPALERVEGFGPSLARFLHVDLSGAFAGRVNPVVPPAPAPYRYVYLMRRKAGTTHDEYLDHYTRIHAEFGRRTPATSGYTQLHLDEDTSRRVAQAAGLGGHCADSVSELWLPSVEEFLKGIAASPVASEGPADEENFVDRPNSVGQCMAVRVGATGAGAR